LIVLAMILTVLSPGLSLVRRAVLPGARLRTTARTSGATRAASATRPARTARAAGLTPR
jgi:hypothetical protein